MITINFLPWRERLRYKRRRKFILSCLFGCLLIIAVILSIYVNLHHKVALHIKRKVNQAPGSSIKNFVRSYKLIGVILKEQKHWALILTPNNKVIMVKQGALIGKEQARIKKITSAKIAVLINDKLLWLKMRDEK